MTPEAMVQAEIDWCQEHVELWRRRQRQPLIMAILNLAFLILFALTHHPILALTWAGVVFFHSYFYFWIRAKTAFYRQHRELWLRLRNDPSHTNDYLDQMQRSLDHAANCKWWQG